MQSFTDFKREVFAKRPDVKKAYDDLELEYTLIQRMIDMRINHGITQADLAKKVGTKQSAISRFEAGGSNPTIGFLKRLADALDVDLRIVIS